MFSHLLSVFLTSVFCIKNYATEYENNMNKGLPHTLVVCSTGSNASFYDHPLKLVHKKTITYPPHIVTFDWDETVLKNTPHIRGDALIWKTTPYFHNIYIERPPADEFLEILLEKYYQDFKEDNIKRFVTIEWDPYSVFYKCSDLKNIERSFCGMFDVNTFINGWLYFLKSEKEKKEVLDTVNKLKKLNNDNFDTQSIISFSDLLEKKINFLKEKGFWKENYKNILEEEFKSFEKTLEGISLFCKTKYPQTLICNLVGRISIDQAEERAINFVKKLGFKNVKLEKDVRSPVNGRPVVSLLKFEFTPLQ